MEVAENSSKVIEKKIDLSEVSSNKLLYHIIGYTQVVNEARHISGSERDHIYHM